MKYRSHLAIAGLIAVTTVTLNYINIFDINTVLNALAYVFNKSGLVEMSKYTFTTNDYLVLLIVYMFSNLLPDLDNPNSKIGRIFFFISIPAWILSVVIYRVLYPRSFNGINNSFGGGISGFIQTTKVTHRVLFHTELGLILLYLIINIVAALAHFSDITEFIILSGVTLGYIMHLICDAISGKVPYPIFVRLIFLMLGIKKEVYGLSLGIGK